MAHLGFNINREELPPVDNDYGVLPEGVYTARTLSSDLKDTKTGGQRIELCYSITGPDYVGRRIYQSFNIRNVNPKAEEIAYKQLNEFMSAAGILNIEDTDQMIGHDLQIALKIKRDAEYGDKNEVKKIMSLTGSAAPAPAPTQAYAPPAQAAPAAPATTRTAPPWKR